MSKKSKKRQKKNLFKTFNIYLAKVPFIDHVGENPRYHHSKWRPIISLGMHHRSKNLPLRVLTASITTRFKSHANAQYTGQIQRSSSYLYRVHQPKQCGLRKRSYIDTHIYRWIPINKVYKHIGRLSMLDRYNWYRFVLAHKGAYDKIVWHFWTTFIERKFDF